MARIMSLTRWRIHGAASVAMPDVDRAFYLRAVGPGADDVQRAAQILELIDPPAGRLHGHLQLLALIGIDDHAALFFQAGDPETGSNERIDDGPDHNRRSPQDETE